MSKSVEAFRTIGEVAEELDVPKHVLRFWEGKFPHIRPMKRGGGRRYYRPEDMELLRGIRHLLHAEGYTIKGVQKILRQQGVDQVKVAAAAAASSATAATSDKATKSGSKSALASKALPNAKEKAPAASLKAVTENAKLATAKDKTSDAATTQNSKTIIAAAIRELEICRQLLIAGGAKSSDRPAQQFRVARS
jgi:DNA-binding transcriptional MerR regulator